MAIAQWRRFNFFTKEVVESNASGKTFDMIKDKNFQCCTCGRGFLIFGDDNGYIHMVDHNFQVNSCQAFRISVQHLVQVVEYNVLAAVGTDEAGVNPVIKIYNLDKKDKSGELFCCRLQPAIPNNEPSEVSAFSVSGNLTMMAAGFAQGSIVLYKGDVMKDRHGNKVIVLETKQTGPITGLGFQYSDHTNLFATTHTQVLCYSAWEKHPTVKLLEDQGCPMFCTTMSGDVMDNQFLMAASDVVYAYHPDTRGTCYAFDGDKVLARWYHGYLVLVYKDKTRGGSSIKALRSPAEKNMLTIYDVSQKIIAYSHALLGVKDVLYEWGSLYVLTAENVLVCLQEIDIHSKLELLFKKNHYSLAVSMARNQNLGHDSLMEIYTQYGDHLYSKGDFDDAISQYQKTIGHLEPSYVIRKFLDAQRITNLTSYLQALHERGQANEDHTTLLLNCFTKLKDTENLDKFLSEDTNLKFDVETAIKVCRQAAYYKQALKLAECHKKHAWYLKIQIENLKHYGEALAYIRQLPYREATESVKKYGKLLLKQVPRDTTELLKHFCKGYKPTNQPFGHDEYGDGDESTHANGEEYIHIFVNNSEMLIEFLQHVVNLDHKSSGFVYNTLLELYLSKIAESSDAEIKRTVEDQALDLLKEISSLDYDTDQALVLCQMHCFRPGILFLYESTQLYQQILRYHMDHEAYGLVVETCRRHGSKDSSLWQQALTFFAQQEDSRCNEHIKQVLAHIDRNNLLPPLLVIQILSRNSTVTLEVVRDYILKRLEKEQEEIDQHQNNIKECEEETEKMKAQIEELNTSATIFQVNKCSLCNHKLELPSVHFLCKHSFHQHCFDSYADSDKECPVCAPENRKILEHVREQEQALLNNQNMYDQFCKRIQHTNEGFSVIAEYFGKGVFNKVGHAPEAKVLNHAVMQSKSLLGSRERVASNPVKHAGGNAFGHASVNPLEHASSNPFGYASDNPFESAGSNPFASTASNPFVSSPQTDGNPFESSESSNANPFEGPSLVDELRMMTQSNRS